MAGRAHLRPAVGASRVTRFAKGVGVEIGYVNRILDVRFVLAVDRQIIDGVSAGITGIGTLAFAGPVV